MKKFTIIFMAIIIFFLPLATTYNQVAHANVVSKPISFAAKKAAKELANEVAVEMVGNLALKLAVNTYENHKVESGFKPICLIGGKSDINDCPPDKKAQIKENLTSTDKSNLKNKVENVIELKTNTSSKWAKFLDWFVPIFLVSGLIAVVSSAINGDASDLIDEVAYQALIDGGLIKPLQPTTGSNNNYQPVKFSEMVRSVRYQANTDYHTVHSFYLDMVSGSRFTYSIPSRNVEGVVTSDTRFGFSLAIETPYMSVDGKRVYSASAKVAYFLSDSSNRSLDYRPTLAQTEFRYPDADSAADAVRPIANNILKNEILTDDVNATLNNLFSYASANINGGVVVSLQPLEVPPIQPDWGIQSGIDYVKQNGLVSVPGIDAFTFTDPATQSQVYPSPDGWRNKDTGELVQVNEDTIIAKDKLGEEDTPPKEEFPSCAKDFKKIEFKKVGTAFTYAFPFSIPWDIKRFLDNAFSGVGDARPSFSLPSYLGDVKLEIPVYFDAWIGFLRTFIIIMFDISLIYLFYRFMRGGGD